MELHDLTDTPVEKIALRLRPRVFFLWNRSGNFEFSFERAGAAAHIFVLFTGSKDESFDFSLFQHHREPNTFSNANILAVLDGSASLRADGLIRIEANAEKSDASQSHRTLLLSEKSRAISKPALEILASDVSARHASATGSPDPESVFALTARGLSVKNANRLLAEGAVRNFFDEMRKYTDDESLNILEKRALEHIRKSQ